MICGLQFSSSPCFPKNVANCISVAAFLSETRTEMPESTGLKTFLSGMSFSSTWDMTAGVRLSSGKGMDVRSPWLMGVGFLRRLKKKTFLRLQGRMSGVTSLGPEVSFPLIHPGRGTAGIQQRGARVQSLCSLVELGPRQHQAGCSPSATAGVGVLQAGDANPGASVQTSLFRIFGISDLPVLAVATILAKDLFPGVTDQVPSLWHPGLTGHVSVLLPRPWGVSRCSSLAKACLSYWAFPLHLSCY